MSYSKLKKIKEEYLKFKNIQIIGNKKAFFDNRILSEANFTFCKIDEKYYYSDIEKTHVKNLHFNSFFEHEKMASFLSSTGSGTCTTKEGYHVVAFSPIADIYGFFKGEDDVINDDEIIYSKNISKNSILFKTEDVNYTFENNLLRKIEDLPNKNDLDGYYSITEFRYFRLDEL